jgi:anti-sigma factor RsiW
MNTKTGLMRRLKGTMLKRMHSMITCREFEDFVIRYLDGELPAKQAKTFEWHMRICRECREYLSAYRRAIEIGKAALGPADKPVPAEVPEDLVKAVLESREK